MQGLQQDNVIYLDNNATTALSATVKDTIKASLDKYYNPSSLYKESQAVKEEIDNARGNVAALINAYPENIFFNSGATEGNNTVIFNCVFPLNQNKKHIVISSVEHPAIWNTVAFYEKNFDLEVTRLKVDHYGRISKQDLKSSLRSNTVLVSIMLANNETGNIYPIQEFAEEVNKYNPSIAFHTDATQAIGKMKVDVKALGVDYLTLSGHKFHAPKGVGALFVRSADDLIPFIHGGHQESGRRAGTDNVISILAMGEAAKNAQALLDYDYEKIANLRNEFERRLKMVIKDAEILGDLDHRICNTSCVMIPRIDGKNICTFVSAEANICISSGSACDSNDIRLSHVMEAMQVKWPPIRVSLSRDNTEKDIITLVQSIMKYKNRIKSKS